ncbi:dTMP kinase [Polymorphobacter fuscus]|uniref:Thymidylate kinase n=1 Tax=Sandarakinorhabdus fusca TaxID=1439888 RepID=A0A7C9KK46_9SPHN|nr:dTMP kinase [Polymorphobacter fuscus]KAB7648683.1 dTMP kinase [Polymorphobacter fuscus]MQT16243.1 dTMP kinase [Polymorphobacter fuscus]NJC07472.1 dTMP kinase [Polymorphobacter fuscus]
MAGRFISFEGGEGSGKSTQARLLADALSDAGQAVVLTREPGGTVGAEALRRLLVTGAADRWSAWAETCLVNAARADHVERVIRPALARGDWVICDRYVDSTRAYQGAGKGIADAELCTLHRQVTGDLWPDITIVMMISADLGLQRARSRDDGEARFESHDVGFHGRIARFFARLPINEARRCHGFHADQPVATLAAQIAAHVRP